MPRNTFRQRVLSLAAMLVTSAQLLTLLPVLNAVKTDVEQRARQTVTIGGSVFDQFMRTRSEQLRTTVDVLVSDFGFKQAVASADTQTIRSVLLNHGGRVDADMGVLLDLDGNILANSSVDPSQQALTSLANFVTSGPAVGATDVVIYADGVPYQSVVVPLRAPLPVAWVVMGFQLDRELAARIEGLTGLDVSFLDRSEGSAGRLLESTLPAGRQAALTGAIERIPLGSANIATLAISDADYLTVLRPFSSASAHVQVALQLSLADAMARYRSIRTILLFVTLVSLLLAVAGTYWLAGTVTEPVYRLVAATRRLREGVYSEPIEVPKSDEFGELARSFNAMQHAIAEREERIAHQAYHDALSGLPNRERLLQLLEPRLAHELPLTVISFSIDRFDRIASSLGHSASDEVLKLVADILDQNLRDGQYLAHLGGNEFVVALEGADPDAAVRWIDHLGHLLHAGVSLVGANISLRATAGVALFPDHSDNGPDLLRRAAVARTNAVTSRESFAVFVPGDEDRHRRQMKIIGDFPAAIRNDELCLFLQPKISCTTHAVIGAEALVRWEHPELGLLQPADFVDVIEGAGVIGHLTRWITKAAMRQCRLWREGGLELTVAVNLSVYDLLDEYLPYFLMEMVKDNGLHASDLTLEVTESAIMHNVSLSLTVLECIRDLGFGVALDDFGTGQSSLTQLRRLPLDEVKIDKSFVMNMGDQKDDVIVRATIELAHKLGLRVVGEGVETADLLERLTDLGCESAQGYYISKPVSAAEFPSWARRWQLAHDPNVIELKPCPAETA
jgi:diguanylate cyclase (GGDEF)-like protein